MCIRDRCKLFSIKIIIRQNNRLTHFAKNFGLVFSKERIVYGNRYKVCLLYTSCIGCAAARFENLEAGAKVHGVDPDVMVDEINALIEANE